MDSERLQGLTPLLALYEFLKKNNPPDDHTDFLDSNGDWECNKCGACCAWVDWFMPDDNVNNGVCKFLQKDRTCMIYSDRPRQCVVGDIDPIVQASACSWIRSNFTIVLEEGGY